MSTSPPEGPDSVSGAPSPRGPVVAEGLGGRQDSLPAPAFTKKPRPAEASEEGQLAQAWPSQPQGQRSRRPGGPEAVSICRGQTPSAFAKAPSSGLAGGAPNRSQQPRAAGTAWSVRAAIPRPQERDPGPCACTPRRRHVPGVSTRPRRTRGVPMVAPLVPSLSMSACPRVPGGRGAPGAPAAPTRTRGHVSVSGASRTVLVDGHPEGGPGRGGAPAGLWPPWAPAVLAWAQARGEEPCCCGPGSSHLGRQRRFCTSSGLRRQRACTHAVRTAQGTRTRQNRGPGALLGDTTAGRKAVPCPASCGGVSFAEPRLRASDPPGLRWEPAPRRGRETASDPPPAPRGQRVVTASRRGNLNLKVRETDGVQPERRVEPGATAASCGVHVPDQDRPGEWTSAAARRGGAHSPSASGATGTSVHTGPVTAHGQWLQGPGGRECV